MCDASLLKLADFNGFGVLGACVGSRRGSDVAFQFESAGPGLMPERHLRPTRAANAGLDCDRVE